MSDEAHFHLTGYMNKQNYCYWADINPNQVHECPLHTNQVTVWCAVSSQWVIGPYFLENEQRSTLTIIWDWYVEILQYFAAYALNTFPQRHETWF